MRPRQLIDRFRNERNPVFKLMIGAAGLMLLLSVCALCGAGAVVTMSVGVAQFGPGGAFSDIQEGQAAPDLTLETLDGQTVSLSDYRGAPVALNFWATWCVPCVLEIPALNAATQDYADDGLVVLSVDVGEPRGLVAPFAEEHDITYEVLLDPSSEVSDAYGIVGMPTTIWIDAEGVIRAVDHGVLDEDRIAEHMAVVTALAEDG